VSRVFRNFGEARLARDELALRILFGSAALVITLLQLGGSFRRRSSAIYCGGSGFLDSRIS